MSILHHVKPKRNNMNSTILKAGIGSLGIAASEVAANAETFSPENISNTGNILVQIVILISTLFGLFRKKKRRY